MNRLFPKALKVQRALKPDNITLRGFGGGLNAVSDDLSMDPRFSVELENYRRTAGGGQAFRFGSNWYADVSSEIEGDDIIDMTYFAGSIIAVSDAGEIARVDGDGVVTIIWNEDVANNLPGAPSGWSSGIETLDFVPHVSDLIIHNGVDKPVTIDSSFNVTYLSDEGTGSNVNVPIGKYGCVVSNYHCVAGIPGSPTTVEVASTGTSGTFIGDPIPNDAISFDVGAFAPEGVSDIRGIAGFRANLIVFFRGQSVVIKLGGFNDAGAHIPIFPDTFPKFGLLGHRCKTTIENDLVFGGLGSVASAKRNLFSVEGLIESERLSHLIEPLYSKRIGQLNDSELLRGAFMVNASLNREIWIITPSPFGASTTKTGFVYSFDDKLRYRSWSTMTVPAWNCACTSFLGRVFVARGMKIFQCGNAVHAGENYAADSLNDRDRDWAPSTAFSEGEIIRDTVTDESYTNLDGHVSGSGTFAQDRAAQVLAPKWELYLGEPIQARMELPWLDGKNPMQTKALRHLSIGSKGISEFIVDVYVDNLYKDNDGNIIYDPALSLDMIGNDAVGYGADAGPYGGGRRSGDPRLLKFPVRFKTIKFVIRTDGSRKPLQLANLSALFTRHGYKR